MRTTATANGMALDRPAGFWRRIFAGVFDIVFLMTAALVLLLDTILAVQVAAYFGWGTLESPESGAVLWFVQGVVWYGTATILLPVFYYTLTEGACGQTLGKALFGIVVVSDDGRPVGYGRAFARMLTLPYALLPAGLGLWWAALPPAKRAWHDYISATRVVAVDKSRGLQATIDQEEAVTSPS